MIQIDMQMPKNCIECPACNEYLMCAIPCNGRGFGENDVKDFSQSRPEWCPMIETEPVKPNHKDAGIFCGNCDSYIRTCETFCSSCGKKIEWERK